MTSQIQFSKRERWRTTYTAVDRQLLERFKSLVLKKYGKIHGFLMDEVNRAIEDYMHSLSLEAEQRHQKEIAHRERSDVRTKLDLIQRALYNDRGPVGEIVGYELRTVIRDIARNRDQRTDRAYLSRLILRKMLREKRRGAHKFGDTVYEIL